MQGVRQLGTALSSCYYCSTLYMLLMFNFIGTCYSCFDNFAPPCNFLNLYLTLYYTVLYHSVILTFIYRNIIMLIMFNFIFLVCIKWTVDSRRTLPFILLTHGNLSKILRAFLYICLCIPRDRAPRFSLAFPRSCFAFLRRTFFLKLTVQIQFVILV